MFRLHFIRKVFIVKNVFKKENEALLADYLHRSADIYFELAPIDVRKLAFNVATNKNLKIPPSWTEKFAAGPDWVNFKNHFLAGGPLGCDGTANKSGCMNDVTMDLWIKHFIHARAASVTEKKMTKKPKRSVSRKQFIRVRMASKK
ncbi:hypothetical protein DAPPUDRAFT_246840 [Daphnia pulex]|uniref:Uncharacterized protein n=1 Tax=Daphnia pulex TaxID=6669 RepID=E9GRB3_DAPPU|nr:hypothetical protein DAPPUDRAFT_246840 [Daphnia pulex]|eukprot:EFX78025.1 hypothetical protein DAPPUDRAFT_246840 [Daphnia pulex]